MSVKPQNYALIGQESGVSRSLFCVAGRKFVLKCISVNNVALLYSSFLKVSKKAFSAHLFMASYHGLSAAMHCATNMKDLEKLREVEELAHDQYEEICKLQVGLSPDKESMEKSLYVSLLRIVRTRLILMPKE